MTKNILLVRTRFNLNYDVLTSKVLKLTQYVKQTRSVRLTKGVNSSHSIRVLQTSANNAAKPQYLISLANQINKVNPPIKAKLE